MGFTEVLTIIFILLKSFNVIDWSWWLVFAPEIVAVVFYILIIILQIAGVRIASKRFDKKFK